MGKHQAFKEWQLFNIIKDHPLSNDLFDPEKLLPDHFEFKPQKVHKQEELSAGDTIDISKVDAAIYGDQERSLKNKTNILYFWLYSCHSCKLILPELKKLQKKIDPKRTRLIGIDPIDDKALKEKFVEEYDVDFSNFLIDRNLSSKVFKVRTFPSVLVIDEEGVVLKAYNGREEDLAEKVQAHLE